MNILSDLLQLLFPPSCVCCGNRLVNGEKFVCLLCLSAIPKTDFHTKPDNRLEQLMAGRFPFVRMASFAVFVKDGSIQRMIHELKYNHKPELGVFIGRLCASSMQGSVFLRDIDCLVPVPLHPNREKKRGYNQSQKIAEGLSKETGIPVLAGNLVRVIDNVSQTKQSKYERWSNTEGIFAVRDNSLFGEKHILLIDDIITTGSTLESCAKTILKAENNAKISVYSAGVVLE
ncbi:MAG: ComF family protein [Prevotella sp.]|jgi:ComF family protein|nr:ComF family protein [Prevotella sp.]